MTPSGDKASRKQLTEQYKRQELLKPAADKNSVFYSYAHIKLGLTLPAIDTAVIEAATDGYQLTEALYQKIIEKVYFLGGQAPGKDRPSREVLVTSLTAHLQAVYYMYLFEGALAIGDADKFFFREGKLERDELLVSVQQLLQAYELMGISQMTTLVRHMRQAATVEALAPLTADYERLKTQISAARLHFIKTNASDYLLP